jgi:hypothetical protein
MQCSDADCAMERGAKAALGKATDGWRRLRVMRGGKEGGRSILESSVDCVRRRGRYDMRRHGDGEMDKIVRNHN